MNISSDRDMATIIENGLGHICDSVKIQVHAVDPDFFALLDFYDDNIFLDPHLIATLSSHHFRTSSMELRKKMLRRILFGYISNDKKPKTIEISTDHNGILYLPGIGYYTTTLPDTDMTLVWNKSGESSYLTDDKHNKVISRFSPVIYVGNTGIEICQSQDPSMTEFFRAWKNDKLDTESFVKVKVDRDLALKVKPEVELAFDILNSTCPEYQQCVHKVCRKLLIFDNPSVRSFASETAVGMSFLSYKQHDDEVFIATEIVHQFGHNILFAVITNKDDFFKVDPKTPMTTFNGNEKDYRTFFSAYHGLFTTTQTAACLEKLLDLNVFEGRKLHELIGRFVDNSRRYHTGLEKCKLDEILTTKGLGLYEYLDRLCYDVYNRKRDIVKSTDITNQPFVFDYNKFVELNPVTANA